MLTKGKKRILIVSQYFYPENFVINDLGFELVKKGYCVEALVGIPNYPEGKYFKGYSIFKRRKEIINGVKVYRTFQFPRGCKAGNFRLSLNYLSYMFSAVLDVFFYYSFKKKYDSILVFQMSPITQAVPAIILGKIKKTKVFTWVLDIWPDSVTDNLSNKFYKLIYPPLNIITEFVYKNSFKLLITSRGMQELICRQSDYFDKIEYMPNWSRDYGLKIKTEIPDLPKGHIIMMAGNLGEGIGVEDIFKCIKNLSDLSDLSFVFVGNGSRKEDMEQYFKKNNLSAYTIGRFPPEVIPALYEKADAMLLTLQKTTAKHLDVTVPARLQSYMSASKPVFAMIGSGAANLIRETDCGFVVPAGDYNGLAEMIRDNYKNTKLLEQKGKNARLAYEEYFTLDKGISRFESLINN